MRRLILAIALFLLLPMQVWAATYYVCSDGGDDTRTSEQAQSLETPWANHPDSNLATDNAAAISLAAGDTVALCKGGIWYDTQLATKTAGADGNPVITTSYGTGNRPIVSGAALLNGAWTDTETNGEFKIACTPVTRVVYNGDTKLTSGTPGSLGNNGFGWLLDELYVKIGSDPTGGSIQASRQTQTILVSHNYRTYNGIDFRQSNGNTPGVVYQLSTTGLTLTDCDISRINLYAVRWYGSTGMVMSGCTLTGDQFEATSILAFMSNGSASGTFFNNTFAGGNTALVPGSSSVIYGNTISGSLYGIDVIGGDNNQIYLNDIANWTGIEYGTPGADGTGIQVSGSGNVITRNDIHDSYVGAILKTQSGAGANIFAHNIVRDSHVNGLHLGCGGTATAGDIVANNTFIHNPTAGDPSGSVGHAIVITSAETHTVECNFGTIKNNLFVGESSGAEMISIDANLDIYASGDMDQIDIDYNLYWQRNAGAAWRFSDVGGDVTDFATWKTQLAGAGVTGADAHSINIPPTGASPVVDIDGNNFHLQPSSSAIYTGTDVSLTSDFDGLPIRSGVSPCIGAYESWPKIF